MPDKPSNMSQRAYVGRFAPSPTGPLHSGSIVAALASFLDARAHGGTWLIRIEDIDGPREQEGAAQAILRSLQDLQMNPDGPVLWQSQRGVAYARAVETLVGHNLVYPCSCSRREILETIARREGVAVDSLRGTTLIYPGTCRDTLGHPNRDLAYRLKVNDQPVRWSDRPAGFMCGQQRSEVLSTSTGDFNVRRSDGLWAYQLAVVVDDAFSNVTDIVRGDDLADSTGRQVYLQQCLGLESPATLHIPVLTGRDGVKLSKQAGASPTITSGSNAERIALLNEALAHLGLAKAAASTLPEFWHLATQHWANSRWMAR